MTGSRTGINDIDIEAFASKGEGPSEHCSFKRKEYEKWLSYWHY